MKKSYDINQKVNEILKASDSIKQAEPNPFFYTRLYARMQRELLQPKTVLGFQLKPTYAYIIVFALVVINIFAMTNFKIHQNQPVQEDRYSFYQTENF